MNKTTSDGPAVSDRGFLDPGRPLTRSAPAGESAGSGPSPPGGRRLGFEILRRHQAPPPGGRGLFFLMILALSLGPWGEGVRRLTEGMRGLSVSAPARPVRAAITAPSATALGDESLAEKPRQGRQRVFVGRYAARHGGLSSTQDPPVPTALEGVRDSAGADLRGLRGW
jgi:hypothetical protein